MNVEYSYYNPNETNETNENLISSQIIDQNLTQMERMNPLYVQEFISTNESSDFNLLNHFNHSQEYNSNSNCGILNPSIVSFYSI